jgi:hypothetical protein
VRALQLLSVIAVALVALVVIVHADGDVYASAIGLVALAGVALYAVALVVPAPSNRMFGIAGGVVIAAAFAAPSLLTLLFPLTCLLIGWTWRRSPAPRYHRQLSP